VLRVLAGILSALVLVVAVGGYTAYKYFDGQVARIRLSLGGNRPAETAGAANFLIVGSDSRAGTGSEFQSQGLVEGERSDTTIVAHLAPDGTTTLVSFPRDTLVAIPGHGKGKLNSAITIGGPSLLIRTIEQMTQLRIDHYLEVDLAGFRDITNAIGGVTVCVAPLPGGSTANLYDPWSQWRGVIGVNHLDGEQALAFVRQRHGLPNGDFDRIHRQQQFISAVFQKATSSGVLADPVKLSSLLQAVLGSLTIDDTTSVTDLESLATRLHGLRAKQITFETIPVHTPTAAEGGDALGNVPVYGSVQLYNPAGLSAFLAPLRGAPPPSRPAVPAASARGGGTTTIPPGPVSPRSAVRVDVFNATGVPGMAARTTNALAAAGFTTGEAQTWTDGPTPATTEIRYAPGSEADARAVAAVLPGAQMISVDPSLGAGSVSLVLGSGFTGLDRSAGDQPGSDDGSGDGMAPTTARPTQTAADLTAHCTY
jgi:LCP family protein required for cell wall assembly